jgi:SOS-response transcriptional repressor LexA
MEFSKSHRITAGRIIPIMAETLKTRVNSRLAALKINPFEAARRGGLERGFVNDILNDKKTSVRGANLAKLAKGLDCDQGYLLGAQDTPRARGGSRNIAPLPIAFTAEAGAFRDMSTFDDIEASELPTIDAPRSKHYPRARHFAVAIRGDSMNATKPLALTEGTYALCVDVIDAEIAVQTGQVYAVRRTRDGGQSYEVTIKRAKVFKDRIELHPESTNPKYKPINIPIDSDPASTRETAAIGWVYGVFGSFES